MASVTAVGAVAAAGDELRARAEREQHAQCLVVVGSGVQPGVARRLSRTRRNLGAKRTGGAREQH
jgi:hypothetical protein